jgi:hypothetical protein
MDLKSDKQQHIQTELDFPSALAGEARGMQGRETESLVVTVHDICGLRDQDKSGLRVQLV